MKALIVDTETTSGGNVYDPDHKLFWVGLYDGSGQPHLFDVEFGSQPYASKIAAIQSIIDQCDLLIAFNAKFDIQWLRRYGIKTQHKPLWDLQYAEFCFSNQSWKMPDCDTACKNRGLEGKLPFNHDENHSEKEWTDYLTQDLQCEWGLFVAQKKALENEPQLKKLIWHGSQDIIITAEMEWNGLRYDHDLSYRIGEDILRSIELIDCELYSYAPWPYFSFASPINVSALLYGGDVSYETKRPYLKVYKRAEPRLSFKMVDHILTLPRLVDPLPATESKKEGYFSTEEGVLKRLKATGKAKEIVDLLLKRRGLVKLVGTYYHGIPKLAEEKKWQNGLIHGQLHHVTAATGRLSSQNPNLQNIEGGVRQCIISRFPLKSMMPSS